MGKENFIIYLQTALMWMLAHKMVSRISIVHQNVMSNMAFIFLSLIFSSKFHTVFCAVQCNLISAYRNTHTRTGCCCCRRCYGFYWWQSRDEAHLSHNTPHVLAKHEFAQIYFMYCVCVCVCVSTTAFQVTNLYQL